MMKHNDPREGGARRQNGRIHFPKINRCRMSRQDMSVMS